MKIGYARVSTSDQTTAAQLAALEAAGCNKVYQEKASTRARMRPELDQALAALNAGDVLVIWRFDRLARSVADMVRIVEQIETNGAHFTSLTEQIDTTTPTGRAMFHIAAAFAQLERDVTRERTMAGLAAARAAGRTGGRPRALTRQQIVQAFQLVTGGQSIRAVARTFKVAPSTLSKALDAHRRAAA